MQVRIVEYTQSYRKQAKSLLISEDLQKKIDSWAKSFNFTVSPRSDMVFRTPRRMVEIWEVRIPNPDKRKGASGGFRMLCFYVVAEETMFLDYIQERNAKGKAKEKQAYTAYLRSLKGDVSRLYDPR